jgi:hypothetical protein
VSRQKKINEANAIASNLVVYQIDLAVDIDQDNWAEDREEFFNKQKSENHKAFVTRLAKYPGTKSGGRFVNPITDEPSFPLGKNKKLGAYLFSDKQENMQEDESEFPLNDDEEREEINVSKKYISSGQQNALAGDIYLHSNDPDLERQSSMVKDIVAHQKKNRENPKQATFFVSIAEHFGSNSLKEILLEASFSDEDIPNNFYLITNIGPRYGKEDKYTQQIVDGKLKGVEGISGSRKIVGSFFNISGNAILLLPGKETVKKNKLSKVLYGNVDYLLSNNMSALKRIANKTTNMDLLYSFIVAAGKWFEKIGYRKEGEMLYNSGINHSIKDKFNSLKINNIHDLARLLKNLTVNNLKAGESHSVSGKYYGEQLEKVSEEDWKKALKLWAEDLGSEYKTEDEWVVKNKELLIPSGTFIMINEDDEDAENAIKEYGLDKKYRLRRLSLRQWKDLQNKFMTDDLPD